MEPKSEDECLTLRQIDKGVFFYSDNDERAFFEWLERLPCFGGFEREGYELNVRLKRRPRKADLREIIALYHRYGLNMRELRKFETRGNATWLRSPEKYWYESMFGTQS